MWILNRDNFHVDFLPPLVGTAIATLFASKLMTTKILGHLSFHLISPQSALVISGITTFSSSLLQNFIEDNYLKYLSIPIGFSIAILSHRFIYPGIKWGHIIDSKGTIAILATITMVKMIMENWKCLKANTRSAPD